MENKKYTGKKVLIVEDQEMPTMVLSWAVEKVMPSFFEGFDKRSYDVARCYSEAKDRISNEDYEVILLDHKMPRENQTVLEASDSRAFARTLENIGYRLIPEIQRRNPECLVIGTSSLLERELRGYKAPVRTLDKSGYDLDKTLRKILIKELKGGI
ncbi:hypothetical protein COU61_04565 [Candidatus Pacearchaeota archaeon CG10_big_fil_rev_8_21_14_0_10_35_13]|nr:MAG: hypothetical protein COU61_04565 [Candidatus Pacearchaeota archaeon CG10_big_fil_rev_8_21_14_0_10_35_13]